MQRNKLLQLRKQEHVSAGNSSILFVHRYKGKLKITYIQVHLNGYDLCTCLLLGIHMYMHTDVDLYIVMNVATDYTYKTK